MNKKRLDLIKAFLEAGGLKEEEEDYSITPVEDIPQMGWDWENKVWVTLSHSGPGVIVDWETGDRASAELFFKNDFTVPGIDLEGE